MSVKQLDHLNLTVENLEESVTWYGRVFGFEVVERGARQGRPWAVLKAGDAMLCAYEQPDRKIADWADLDSTGRHGMRHFALRCVDRESWEETLRREALPTTFDSPVDYPHSTSWYVRDPTGYEIEVAMWDEDEIAFEPA